MITCLHMVPAVPREFLLQLEPNGPDKSVVGNKLVPSSGDVNLHYGGIYFNSSKNY